MTTLNEEQGLGPFMQNAYGDRYLYPVNREAFNQVGATLFYDQHFQRQLDKENTLYVIVGTDSGLLVHYLNQNKLPKGSRFLLVELPEVMERLPEVLEEELQSQMVVVSPDLLDEQLNHFQLDDYTYLNNVSLYESVAVSDQTLPDYIDLASFCHQTLEQRTWQVRASLGNRDFPTKQMQNLPENRTGFHLLHGLFEGKTAVIAGAGPSLDDAIPWIKAHRDDLIVLAVSRTSRRLKEVGVVPDFICTIDPQTVSFTVSREALGFENESILLGFYHGASELIGQWMGTYLYCDQRVPWQSEVNDDVFGFVGPTVSHMAINSAILLGCSQIVLTGVDLCFSRSGHSHAQGNAERKTGYSLVQKNLVTVQTNGGWTAETTAAYANGIGAIEMLAERARQRGAQLVNPAPGAAAMEGVVHHGFDQIVPEKMEQSAQTVARRSLPEDDADYRLAHYKRMLDELEKTRSELQTVQRLCNDALKANEGLFGRGQKKASFHYKKKMDQIEARLNDEFGGLTRVVKNYGGVRFLELVSPGREMSGWTDDEIEAVGRGYYTAYIESTRDFTALIDSATERLHLRQQEESAEPDWCSLVDLWQRDNTPRRYRLWQQRHPDLPVPSEVSATLWPQLEETYQKIYAADLRDEFDPLYLLQEAALRAKVMYRRRDHEGLVRLQSLVEPRHESFARPVKALIDASLAELEGDREKAQVLYNQLLDCDVDNALIEVALRRILSIALDQEDMENALLALQCLAEINPIFIPKYAELLRILGQVDAAIAVYEKYTERFPADYAVLLKMAQLHARTGNPKGAVMIAEFILQHQPGYKPAELFLQQLKEQDDTSSEGGSSDA